MHLIKEADRPPSDALLTQHRPHWSTVPGVHPGARPAELLPVLTVPTGSENTGAARGSVAEPRTMTRRSGFGPWSGHRLGAGSMGMGVGVGVGAREAAGQRFSLIVDVPIARPSSL